MEDEHLGYGSSTQFGEVEKCRCRMRETCALTGAGLADGWRRRAGLRRGGVEGTQPGSDAGMEARNAPLTTLEQAVVKVLPRWPEAYRAVMEYAHKAAGPFPRGGMRPVSGDARGDKEVDGP